MLPEEHRLIRSETMNDWNITYTQSRTSKAVILFRYELDNKTYTNLGAFKIARLKKALININNTKLHWIYLTCENDCKTTIEQFFK